MPVHAEDLLIQTTQHAAFALSCVVPRGVAYLSDPAVVLGALPSVERVIHRQRGTFRITLAPVQIPGVSLRPAAEVLFVTAEDRVTIRSAPEGPHALQSDEVATRVSGLFALSPARTGCAVRASLTIEAQIPARVLPPSMLRVIAYRTAETILTLRMKQEIGVMTRTLMHGYAGWGAEFGTRGSGDES